MPLQHRARALNYLVLMRLDRPVGALLLLWPTWWALWFAANDFPPIGGVVPYDILVERTDPALVRLQLDTGNMVIGGGGTLVRAKPASSVLGSRAPATA